MHQTRATPISTTSKQQPNYAAKQQHFWSSDYFSHRYNENTAAEVPVNGRTYLAANKQQSNLDDKLCAPKIMDGLFTQSHKLHALQTKQRPVSMLMSLPQTLAPVAEQPPTTTSPSATVVSSARRLGGLILRVASSSSSSSAASSSTAAAPAHSMNKGKRLLTQQSMSTVEEAQSHQNLTSDECSRRRASTFSLPNSHMPLQSPPSTLLSVPRPKMSPTNDDQHESLTVTSIKTKLFHGSVQNLNAIFSDSNTIKSAASSGSSNSLRPKSLHVSNLALNSLSGNNATSLRLFEARYSPTASNTNTFSSTTSSSPSSSSSEISNNNSPTENEHTRVDSSSSLPPDAVVCIAMHSYDAALSDGDMRFSKGDRMQLLDASDPEWWLVNNLDTNTNNNNDSSTTTTTKGYVPRSYLARCGTLDCEDWYFGALPRHQAEYLLKSPHLPTGAYLLRNCTSAAGAFVLSIRDCNAAETNTTNIDDVGCAAQQPPHHCPILSYRQRQQCGGLLSASPPHDEGFASDADTTAASRRQLSSSKKSPLPTTTITNSLSVRELLRLSVSCQPCIKHYKIKTLDNDRGYFISTKQTFPTLNDLIRFYAITSNNDGLCCPLTIACPRPKPRIVDLSPSTRQQGEIHRSQLQFVRKLGAGQFGEVFYGLFAGRHPVAIKMVKPSSSSTVAMLPGSSNTTTTNGGGGGVDRQAFLHEIIVMKKCNHEHLVRLYAFCTREEPYLMVMEYLKHGCLLDYLRHGKGQRLKFARMVQVAAQVASGMSYLERIGLIHRDLAARNILVGENLTVKIADFGLARVLRCEEKVYTSSEGAKFPLKWTAPEAALYKKFSIKSDVWSYGVVLYEIVSRGQSPYPGIPSHEVIYNLQRGYRMPKPATCPDAYYNIMLQCWNGEPARRPTFDFLYHFFADYEAASENAYRDCDT